MEQPLLDIQSVCNNLNDDISKLINSHLSPLINDMKLASSSLNAIRNILYSLPEYKELEKELSELRLENESLKQHLNNKEIRMEITEKYNHQTDNNIKNFDYNITTPNKVIDLTSNTSLTEEMNILSNTSDDEDSQQSDTDENISNSPSNLQEITKTVTIDVTRNTNQNDITLSNKQKIQEENIDSEEESEEEDDQQEDDEENDEEDSEEEEEKKNIENESEVKEEGSDKLLENKEYDEEEAEEEEEEEEEVFEIDIEGKTYFTTGKTNGIVYEYLVDEDDIGDKVGEFKNGVLIWKNK